MKIGWRLDPSQGSNNMALGTQQVPKRAAIRIHQHREQLNEIAWKHGMQLK
jgi:hypothetical protein